VPYECVFKKPKESVYPFRVIKYIHRKENVKSGTKGCLKKEKSHHHHHHHQSWPARAISLPLLDQEKVHGAIGDDDEDGGEDGQADHVVPEGKGVEAEGAEDRGAGDFDVQAIAVVD
jgi:hypothetical protein